MSTKPANVNAPSAAANAAAATVAATELAGPDANQATGSKDGLAAGTNATRVSYLDVIHDTLQKQGKTTIISRVVVCGELPRTDERPDYAGNYTKLFKQFQTDTDLITGIMLILPGSFIHIIESTQKIALAFLRDLANTANGFLSVRILFYADDIPSRSYPVWATRVIVDSPIGGFDLHEDALSEEQLPSGISELCLTMVKLGTALGSLSRNDLKSALDELPNRFAAHIPSDHTLVAVSKCDSIMSIADYLDIYTGHVKIVLDSELVWPMPKTLVY
ncbi:uncharacterized protein BJ171DRAFT_277093 [Polychytrium aggregatum]|uniref:uncharacterized protein n=1 Tax=Polychytrium aggregatum TaxID=110093 RepID=UPI0022FED038|nr:uncharacterized protein BJ171DRAFT_277093 [Polychytrium aggregatum]KAI9207530.1 hypothetical protein BJ171DRAFT_277093 [Polychytrium aggregatum]